MSLASTPFRQSSGQPFQLAQLTATHDVELSRFLDSLKDRTVGPSVLGYHYPENRDMLLRVLQPRSESCYLAARSSATGAICGVLPGMFHRAGNLSAYNSLPFYGPNVGVLAAADGPEEYSAIAGLLTRAAFEFARSQGAVTAVFYSAFNPNGVVLPNPVLNWASENVIRIPRTTLYTRLPPSEPIHWSDGSRRNDVRRGKRAGIRIKTNALTAVEVDQVFRIYRENCEARGIPLKPKICVETLCAPENDHRTGKYLAYLENRVIGALVVFWGPKTASYYLPCVDANYSSLQPLPLLIDRACNDAVSRGIEYWNWESSPSRDSGVYRFKQKWGAVESNYEITVALLRDLGELRSHGAENLSLLFPYYYLYPYDRLFEAGVARVP